MSEPGRRRPAPLTRGRALAAEHALPLFVAVVFLLPLLWMVSSSFREVGLPPATTIEWLPAVFSPDNYGAVFELELCRHDIDWLPCGFGRYLLNSLAVVALAVPLTIVTASMGGFGMALLERRSRVALVVVSVALLLVPITAIWLTRFLLFSWIGLTDSLLALVVPALAGSSPLFVLLYYWTFRRVPHETFDMARTDGAGVMGTWWRIGMPQAVPTTIAVSVLTFILYWNDFIDPLLYLRSQELYTLPLGLRQLQQLDRLDQPMLMTGAVILTVPAVVFFLLVQRFFLGDRGLGGSRQP